MSRMLRSVPLTRLIPFATLVLLLPLFLQSLSIEAASPPTPLLGITPTATPTVMPTPTPLPPLPTSTPQIGVADPVITKHGEPEEALPGEEVTFTLEVTNQGQQSAWGVVVTDVIAEYLEILEVTTTQGTVTIEGQTVKVEIGVVGPGFVVEIVISTRVREDTPAPLDVENAALLTSPNGGDRTMLPVTIHIPGPLLPPTGKVTIPCLAWAILGSGLAALGAGLGSRTAHRGRSGAKTRRQK